MVRFRFEKASRSSLCVMRRCSVRVWGCCTGISFWRNPVRQVIWLENSRFGVCPPLQTCKISSHSQFSQNVLHHRQNVSKNVSKQSKFWRTNLQTGSPCGISIQIANLAWNWDMWQFPTPNGANMPNDTLQNPWCYYMHTYDFPIQTPTHLTAISTAVLHKQKAWSNSVALIWDTSFSIPEMRRRSRVILQRRI